MKHISIFIAMFLAVFVVFLFTSQPVSAVCSASNYTNYPACTSIDTGDLGFQIPTLADILTFAIRAFFVIAGLVALFYLLLGALGWVTSGGDKDAVTAAREKIQAAVVGMILIVAVLAIIWTLEQVIFKRRICLGLSCPLTLPGLIETTDSTGTTAGCCVCVSNDGRFCVNVPPAEKKAQNCKLNVINTFNNQACGL